MKNKAINTLEYTGVVKLSQYIGTKKVEVARLQNEGNYSLFNFFADCLVGDFEIAQINRPTKIMLLQKEQKDPTTVEYISKSGFIFQTSKPEKVYDTTKGIVRYSFIIPKDLISSIKPETVSHIGLYANSASDGEESNFSALVGVDLTSDNVAASAAVLVDWELNISNKVKEVS